MGVKINPVTKGIQNSGTRKVLDVPLRFIGTDFQKNVWEQLQKATFGQTATYMDLAQAMG